MTEKKKPKYKEGDRVSLKRKPIEQGQIVKEPKKVKKKWTYFVEFDDGRRWHPEQDLEKATQAEDPVDLFRAGRHGHAESCQRYLTYLRASQGITNYVYSFNNSQTDFYVHQFKPLLKFLDNRHGRLLLADEVGLGKTIEAGFILLEMEAREELQRSIVVCPAKLREKWQRELFKRFDMEYEICRTKRLKEELRRTAERPTRDMHLITSYATARRDSIREKMEEAGYLFDIFIADEAHRLRNTETKQYKMGSLLAQMSQKALFLSATPINNEDEDLFTLLNLIDPSLYRDYENFKTLDQLNNPIIEIEKALRDRGELNLEEIRNYLNQAVRLAQKEDLSLFPEHHLNKLQELLEREAGLDSAEDLVEAQRLASRCNLFSNQITRTRRIDVDEDRAKREPHTYNVEGSAEERELYRRVKAEVIDYYDQFALPVYQIVRMLSSSIPAFVDKYIKKVRDKHDADILMDGEEDTMEGHDLPEEIEASGLPEALYPILTDYETHFRNSNRDSKYEELLTILDELSDHNKSFKTIIFTSFKATISYLSSRLEENGYKNVVIHGDVTSAPGDPENDVRGHRIEQFEKDDEIPILLSTEVGSEGLDFQFASTMINYDLPWNPMKVEQRIGRIDRIGQQREKLLIYNLIMKDTIDELIHEKLLTKIDIFERCIGDIESILGDRFDEIRDVAFDDSLTEEERERRIEQKARVIEREEQSIEELEEESSKILGPDKYIHDEVKRIKESRRFVGPEELRIFVNGLLEWSDFKMNVEQEQEGVFVARITERAEKFFSDHLTNEDMSERRFRRLILDRDELRWTFDYDIKKEHEDLEYMKLSHPAVQALIEWIGDREDRLEPTFLVRLTETETESIPPGRYVVGVTLMTFEGEFTRKNLHTIAWDVEKNDFAHDLDSDLLLNKIIAESESWRTSFPISEDKAEKVIDEIHERALEITLNRGQDIESEEKSFLRRRQRQIEQQAEREIESEKKTIDTLREKKRKAERMGDEQKTENMETFIKGAKTRIEQAKERRDRNLREIADPEEFHVNSGHEIKSIGIVKVE